ncbi:MAG: ribonuclease domain-containing protein [Candidatus Nanopelagicales bacterium]
MRSSIARMLAVLFAVGLLAGCAAGLASGDMAGSAGPATVVGGQDQYADLAPGAPTTDLPTVAVVDLPAEGVETLALIVAGGPFAYSKDGAVFGNRERLLPDAPAGFYSEYTVRTPGSEDRGARRIVSGADGSRFYTDDHYDSFREVVSR